MLLFTAENKIILSIEFYFCPKIMSKTFLIYIFLDCKLGVLYFFKGLKETNKYDLNKFLENRAVLKSSGVFRSYKSFKSFCGKCVRIFFFPGPRNLEKSLNRVNSSWVENVEELMFPRRILLFYSEDLAVPQTQSPFTPNTPARHSFRLMAN